MPLQTETWTVDEAIAELEAEREELADEIAQIHPDDRTNKNATFRDLREEAQQVERERGGLVWAREEFGGDTEFTVGGLTTAERAHVDDRVADLQTEEITPTSNTQGAGSIFWIAQGLIDAPFLEDDDGFEDRCAAVRELPTQLSDWLQSQVNDLTTVGVEEGNSLQTLVEEKTQTYHDE